MPDTPSSLFLTYVGPSDIETKYLQLHVVVNGGAHTSLVIDTGSTGIVIGKDWIGGNPVPLSPQPPVPSYSSSGNSYQGQWVYATVEVAGANGQRFSTAAPIPVFASETPVFMMGVGIRSKDPALNPFLNLQQMADGSIPKGFIITDKGVQFGYDAATKSGFTLWSHNGNQDLNPQVTVTLTPPAESNLKPYSETAPVLIDTGINYMIVTPKVRTPMPDLGYTDPNTRQFISNVQVSVAFPKPQSGPPVTWGYNTNAFGQAGIPAYARFAVPSTNGFVNTGRCIVAQYDYLIDTTDGVTGLRKRP